MLTYGIGLLSPSGEEIPLRFSKSSGYKTYQFPVDGSTVYVYDRLAKMQGGGYVIFFRFVTPSQGIWQLRVAINDDNTGDFHIWLPISQFLPEDTYFIAPDPYTTVTSSGCAQYAITATMYNHYRNTLTPEASKGYSRLKQVKPDLAAPGVNIYGPMPGGGYTVKTGSSIAAAHCAGAAALLLEYGAVRGNSSFIDGLEIKNDLILGAQRKPTLVYPNRDWGYGSLNVYNTLQNLVQQ